MCPPNISDLNYAYASTTYTALAVDFDTYQDGFANDINNNHIGIQTSLTMVSAKAVDVTPTVSSMQVGQLVWVWIDYNGTSLSVYLAVNNTKPTTAILSLALNLCTIWPNGPTLHYPGFGGAGATVYNRVAISAWSFATSWNGSLPTIPTSPSAPPLPPTSESFAASSSSYCIIL